MKIRIHQISDKKAPSLHQGSPAAFHISVRLNISSLALLNLIVNPFYLFDLPEKGLIP